MIGAAGVRHMAAALPQAGGKLASLSLADNELCLVSTEVHRSLPNNKKQVEMFYSTLDNGRCLIPISMQNLTQNWCRLFLRFMWFPAEGGRRWQGFAAASFTLAGLHTLADQLERSSLTSLDLSKNELSAVGARVVARALAAAGSPLQTLALAECALGDEGCGVIAAALPRAVGLTALDLSHNVPAGDGDAGQWVPLLAAALPRCPGLATFSLAGNRLGHARVRAASVAAVPGADPSGNDNAANSGGGNDTIDAVAVLAGGISSSSLTALSLAANELPIAGVQALARALVRGGLALLDLSPATPVGTGGEGLSAEGAATASPNGRQRTGFGRWRLYRGSPTGLALQLLNALAAAEAEDGALEAGTLVPAEAAGGRDPAPLLHYVCRKGWSEWTARSTRYCCSDTCLAHARARMRAHACSPVSVCRRRADSRRAGCSRSGRTTSSCWTPLIAACWRWPPQPAPCWCRPRCSSTSGRRSPSSGTRCAVLRDARKCVDV